MSDFKRFLESQYNAQKSIGKIIKPYKRSDIDVFITEWHIASLANIAVLERINNADPQKLEAATSFFKKSIKKALEGSITVASDDHEILDNLTQKIWDEVYKPMAQLAVKVHEAEKDAVKSRWQQSRNNANAR